MVFGSMSIFDDDVRMIRADIGGRCAVAITVLRLKSSNPAPTVSKPGPCGINRRSIISIGIVDCSCVLSLWFDFLWVYPFQCCAFLIT